MISLLFLSFALGLDSFRVSIGLGLTLSRSRQVLMAAGFGICDGLAPLVGLGLGNFLADGRAWVAHLGPLLLGLYGCYVMYLARRFDEPRELRERTCVLWGLPLFLSADNLVAGVGLGMLQYPILVSVTVIGAMSGLLSLAGMRLGGAIRSSWPTQTDMLGGIVLVVIAVVLGVERV